MKRRRNCCRETSIAGDELPSQSTGTAGARCGWPPGPGRPGSGSGEPNCAGFAGARPLFTRSGARRRRGVPHRPKAPTKAMCHRCQTSCCRDLGSRRAGSGPSARRLAGGRDPALGGDQAPERAEAGGELGGGERREVGEAAEAGAVERPDQPRPDPGQPVEVARRARRPRDGPRAAPATGRWKGRSSPGSTGGPSGSAGRSPVSVRRKSSSAVPAASIEAGTAAGVAAPSGLRNPAPGRARFRRGGAGGRAARRAARAGGCAPRGAWRASGAAPAGRRGRGSARSPRGGRSSGAMIS